ncbi:MAG: hypothetical protein CL868_11490 [Cytophagaceae bacterium]|nr:hypothetical protein [Cytophagaceae bacterium]
MKKSIVYLILSSVLVLTSCSTELDNYPAPDGILQGKVVDANTGEPVMTEIGDNGTRIKLLEYSWSDDPTPQYLYSKQDGTFYNDKVFDGTYNVSVEGPFVPLVQTNGGETVVDNSQTVEVRSGKVTNVDFEVEPLLKVEWVGDPVTNEDGTVTVNFKVTRGTDDPDFQPNMNALFLFVNNTQYLGNNNWDNRYSYARVYGGTTGDALLGQTVSLTTVGGALPGDRDYYLRVGARTNYGLQQYNYNAPKKISIP